MSKWSHDRIIHVDREGDRERASDGYSRYGSYLGGHEHDFKDHFSDAPVDAVAFAAAAWRIATPPIMSPGLVDWRPDIEKITLGYCEEGKDLMATVELPLQHHQLAATLPYSYRDYEPNRAYWGNGDYQYLQYPGTRRDRPTVLATVTIRHILRHVTLVTPSLKTGRALVDDCLQSVELTAAALNAELPEIIGTVQGDR